MLNYLLCLSVIMEGASTSSTGEDGGTMEIKIKTLDSQVYTCRVDPNVYKKLFLFKNLAIN